jgi:hypothetical protein
MLRMAAGFGGILGKGILGNGKIAWTRNRPLKSRNGRIILP